ncbi:hypothetical protein BVC80_209g176 [Macleaya cordata]|uniref:Uncharacterized protein n=1 Tax=Macleaya cordata TaxID=56857 RepID=A0A200QD77_MACCD|nr:hypothetical protein BVC80_209g176 [Macleaya cordata]
MNCSRIAVSIDLHQKLLLIILGFDFIFSTSISEPHDVVVPHAGRFLGVVPLHSAQTQSLVPVGLKSPDSLWGRLGQLVRFREPW